MNAAVRGIFAALALLLPVPALAEETPSDFASDYARLQALDARVHAIGWRLKTGNAALCRDTSHETGLLLQDARTYASASVLRRTFGLDGDIYVQAIAPGSPAETAGVSPFAVIESINGRAAAELPWNDDAPWERLLFANALIEQIGRRHFPVNLGLAGEEQRVSMDTVATCATRFEIVSSGDDMGADGQRVRIGRAFPGFAYEDDELAAALAHELAHNVLRHPQWLAANGRKRRDVRETEREADRMMPWLLANAGYEPEAAVRFMRKWGPKHNGGLFRNRTHDGWDERVELIEAELPLIEMARVNAPGANWARRFAPRTVPD